MQRVDSEQQKQQMEMWLNLVADLADHNAEKSENDIEKKDILKIARKVQDIVDVLYGKSKIAGWRM